jgi:hypothetical protein
MEWGKALAQSPSDHGSSASVGRGGIRGRERSSDEANMGADDDFQAIHHARMPQALSQGPPGWHCQHWAFPPWMLPPLISPAEVQAANPHRNLLPATTRRPEPVRVPANPFRGSQATPDMLVMAGTRPQLGLDHLYSSPVRALNQPSGTQSAIRARASDIPSAACRPARCPFPWR